MTHTLMISPAVSENLRYKIKELLNENGFIQHSGCTSPLGNTYNEIVFSKEQRQQPVTEDDEIYYSNPILKFFKYKHLPENLQKISKYFWDLAVELENTIPDSAEKSAGLRKLLEAKDCMVRAAL